MQIDVKKGDRFLVLVDSKGLGLTHWNAPLTSGFECIIPRNTVLVAVHDSAPKSTGVGVVPENYEELEKILVPEQDRTADKYGGYSFVLLYSDIGSSFQKL